MTVECKLRENNLKHTQSTLTRSKRVMMRNRYWIQKKVKNFLHHPWEAESQKINKTKLQIKQMNKSWMMWMCLTWSLIQSLNCNRLRCSWSHLKLLRFITINLMLKEGDPEALGNHRQLLVLKILNLTVFWVKRSYKNQYKKIKREMKRLTLTWNS